ncbi:cupin domain-containing protein [Flagellimonas onchidii]|nr:cupin domain-containing protein [Allomuricauda onchidii]
MSEVDFLIEEFDLAPHPEGGFFKETYRSTGKIEKEALPKALRLDSI